jgi:hypothetical protein
MNMKQVFKVLGGKAFKGTIDGQTFDSTKLFVLMPVSDRAGTEVGYNSAPLPFGLASNFDQIKGLPFPCDLELEVAVTTKGFEVVSIGKVLPASKAAA